jgi:hypothetical protein
MTDFTDRLAPLADDVLEPGERLLAAFRGRAGDSAGDWERPAEHYVGRIGSLLGPRFPRRRPVVDPRTGLPTMPPLLALGLTDRRILVFSRGAVTGRTRAFVGAVPRERIRRLDVEAKTVPFGRDRLTIHLVDGAPVAVETVRGASVERFTEAFHERRGQNADPLEPGDRD